MNLLGMNQKKFFSICEAIYKEYIRAKKCDFFVCNVRYRYRSFGEKPRYRSSFLDRIYKMKYIYNLPECYTYQENTKKNMKATVSCAIYGGCGSYKYSTSYGSYTSYRYSTSYSSYGSQSSSYLDKIFKDTSIFSFPKEFVNMNLCREKVRDIYNNEYAYRNCNIEQSFFVLGYGLELI